MSYDIKRIASFIIEYSVALLDCGATTIRIEKNVRRIADRYGCECDITILPMHVLVKLCQKDSGETYSVSQRTRGTGINYYTNTYLSRLSWRIHDERISLDEAMEEYQDIISRPRMNKWMVLILVGLANACFCGLFSGDFISMLIVFVATIDGFYIKNKLHADMHVDIRLATIVSGTVAAVISCAGFVYGWGSTPDIALATSVLFLVPGIPFINSVSDLIHGHYICCISRFIQATILTICLSLGLCLALLLMNTEL